MGLFRKKKNKQDNIQVYEFKMTSGHRVRIETINIKVNEEEEIHEYLDSRGKTIEVKGTIIPVEHQGKEISIAEKIVVVPENENEKYLDGKSLTDFLQGYFIEDGYVIEIPEEDGNLYFKVLSVFPSTEVSVINAETIFEIKDDSE